MAQKRINTAKTLGNETFYNGGLDTTVISTTSIAVSPLVSDQYDYSVTEDPVLLQERKDTAEILYEIYKKAPFYKEYEENVGEIQKDTLEAKGPCKIPKNDICKVFSYMKEHLQRVKKLSAFETIIAINEFFDFNYEYVVKNVISSKMMAEILEDYYVNMGMSDRMDEVAENPLF